MYRDSRERQSNDRYGSVEAGASSSSKNKKDIGSLPVLPPKIDRQKKPSKKSAAERLFGRSSSSNNSSSNNNNTNNNVTNGKTGDDDSPVNGEASDESPPETRGSTGGFHSMPPSVSENNKKNTFDSNSSSNFDSYNKHAAAESGYAYSRSLSQPANQNGGHGVPHGYSGPASSKFPPPPANNDKYRSVAYSVHLYN